MKEFTDVSMELFDGLLGYAEVMQGFGVGSCDLMGFGEGFLWLGVFRERRLWCGVIVGVPLGCMGVGRIGFREDYRYSLKCVVRGKGGRDG